MIRQMAIVAIISMMFVAGCAHPQGIRNDNATLIHENNALYEFNLKLLDRLPAETEEEFAKKMALREIINTAHYRADIALKLLAEYLDSTEFVDGEDETAIRNFAQFLVDELGQQ